MCTKTIVNFQSFDTIVYELLQRHWSMLFSEGSSGAQRRQNSQGLDLQRILGRSKGKSLAVKGLWDCRTSIRRSRIVESVLLTSADFFKLTRRSRAATRAGKKTRFSENFLKDFFWMLNFNLQGRSAIRHPSKHHTYLRDKSIEGTTSLKYD